MLSVRMGCLACHVVGQDGIMGDKMLFKKRQHRDMGDKMTVRMNEEELQAEAGGLST